AAATPTSVAFRHGALTLPMTAAGGGSYSVTRAREQVTTGAFQLLVTCPGGDPTVQSLGRIVLYDPSGFITDAVSGDPVVGATVALYQVPDWLPATGPGHTGAQVCESNESKEPGDPWSQPAPTDEGVL